jgi:hypothetical protein
MLAQEIARGHHYPPNSAAQRAQSLLKHASGAADIDCIGRNAR